MTRTLPRAEIVEFITARDGYKCALCPTPFAIDDYPTIDHWIPLSKGGTWDLENLKLAHKRCNSLKGDKMPNPDGTIPEAPRRANAQERKARREAARSAICNVCRSGRDLMWDQTCDSCGSGPQPVKYPGWAKMKPSECPHEFPFHCWMESLEPGLRKAAIIDVLDGEGSLDLEE